MWHNFKLHETIERGCCAFIIDSVEDTCIRNIRQAKTIYADVTTKALMNHLQLRCGGLHTLNVVDLTSEMLTYYGYAAHVLGYINMLENAQKKLQRV